MMPPRLSRNQARTQYFPIPIQVARVLLSHDVAEYVASHNAMMQLTGGDTQLYGWQDGTTAIMTRDDAKTPLNPDDMAKLYSGARDMEDYKHAKGHTHAR